MKFKNSGDNQIKMIMSSREVDRYPEFKEVNVIVESLERTVTEGDYELVVNGVTVKLSVKTNNSDGVYKVEGTANGIEYNVIKTREIRKYDVFRVLVTKFGEIKNNVETV